MRNEVLRALDDPAEIADAELVCLGQSAGERQARGVAERSCPTSRELGSVRVEPMTPDSLRRLEIQTEQVTMIYSHNNILTCVAACRAMLWRPGHAAAIIGSWRAASYPRTASTPTHSLAD